MLCCLFQQTFRAWLVLQLRREKSFSSSFTNYAQSLMSVTVLSSEWKKIVREIHRKFRIFLRGEKHREILRRHRTMCVETDLKNLTEEKKFTNDFISFWKKKKKHTFSYVSPYIIDYIDSVGLSDKLNMTHLNIENISQIKITRAMV